MLALGAALAVAMSALLGVPGLALAAVRWQPSVAVSAPTRADAGFDLAASGSRIVAAWATTGPRYVPSEVAAITSSGGQPFAWQGVLSDPSGFGRDPVVAVRGITSAALWLTVLNGTPVVQLRVIRGDGGLGPVATFPMEGMVPGVPGVEPPRARVAIDGHGRPFGAWNHGGAVVLSRGDAAGHFNRPRVVSPRGASVQDLSVDDAGNATVVWTRAIYSSRTRIVIQARTVTSHGHRGHIETLGSGRFISNGSDFGEGYNTVTSPRMAGDRKDRVIVAWRTNQPAGDGAVMTRSRTPGGRWGPVQVFSDHHGVSEGPAVAMNDRGDAAVSWATDRVLVRFRPRSGRFAR